LTKGGKMSTNRNKFVKGFIAGIVIHGIQTLHMKKRTAFYQAFHKALTQTHYEIFKKLIEEEPIDFDSLYANYSTWFELGVLKAGRDLLLTFKDGLTLEIHMSTDKAKEELNASGNSDAFLSITSIFINELKKFDLEMKLSLTKEAKEKLTKLA